MDIGNQITLQVTDNEVNQNQVDTSIVYSQCWILLSFSLESYKLVCVMYETYLKKTDYFVEN